MLRTSSVPEETRAKLRELIRQKRNKRTGLVSMATPHPDDVPPEMKPHMKDIEEISRIIGPITSKKPPPNPKSQKPTPPTKQYTINPGTIFKQQLLDDTLTPNKTPLSFTMSQINLPNTQTLLNTSKSNGVMRPSGNSVMRPSGNTKNIIARSHANPKSTADDTPHIPFTLEAIESLFNSKH